MKKYKLIQTYPGSPSLNTVMTECVTEEHLACPKNAYYTGGIIIGKLIIESSPEHWEEIISKDYEILSFKNVNEFTKIAHIQLNNNFQIAQIDSFTTLGSPLDLMLKDSRWNIHSVKRLSDGEVFTVDDNVHSTLNDSKFLKEAWKNCFIKAFTLVKNTIKIKIEEGDTLGHYSLNSLKVFKKPLFTTEDEVDVFEGDDYYVVRKGKSDSDYSYSTYVAVNNGLWRAVKNCYLFTTLDKVNDFIKSKKPLFTTEYGVDVFEGDKVFLVFTTSYKPTEIVARKELLPIQSYQKLFSIKEAAEEYVLMNKPCLSINDIKKLNMHVPQYYKILRQTVKKKINGN